MFNLSTSFWLTKNSYKQTGSYSHVLFSYTLLQSMDPGSFIVDPKIGVFKWSLSVPPRDLQEGL